MKSRVIRYSFHRVQYSGAVGHNDIRHPRSHRHEADESREYEDTKSAYLLPYRHSISFAWEKMTSWPPLFPLYWAKSREPKVREKRLCCEPTLSLCMKVES